MLFRSSKVTMKQGGKKVKLKVTVKDPKIVFSGKFTLSEEGLDPAWSSSSPGIIRIDQKTGAIEAKAIGKTYIYALVHGVKLRVTAEYLGGNLIRVFQDGETALPTQMPTPTPVARPTKAPTPAPVASPTQAPSVPFVPTVEPTPTPTPTPTLASSWDEIITPTPQVEPGNAGAYVLNINTMKFHYPDCKHVVEIYSQNRRDVVDTRENILSQGFVPCKTCDP